MKQGNRNIVKRLRFLDVQAEQLEHLLELKGIGFTDFIHTLIAHEFLMSQSYVPPYQQVQESVVQSKSTSPQVTRVATNYCKIDPALLRELGRIGNNINQIAKSLNTLCLSHPYERTDFSYLQCLIALEQIQSLLHQHLSALPTISRSEHVVERRREQALRYVTTQRAEA